MIPQVELFSLFFGRIEDTKQPFRRFMAFPIIYTVHLVRPSNLGFRWEDLLRYFKLPPKLKISSVSYCLGS